VRHEEWFGEIVVSRLLRSMTYGSVSSMSFVGVSVRPSSFLISRGGTHIFLGAGTIALAIRSGVSLILLLPRIQRIREVPSFVQGYLRPLICHTDCICAERRVFR